MNQTIGLIDYGLGNLHSVANALQAIGVTPLISDSPEALRSATGLILPGVGAFGDAMTTLKSRGWVDFIKEQTKETPLLGICLGMQLLLDESEELGHWQGLGLIPGKVIRLTAADHDRAYKIPHMGWNRLTLLRESPVTAQTKDGSYVYFVHSYKAVTDDPKDRIAVCDYGEEIAAVIGRGNVFGMQFHPEKSESVGLTMLKQFVSLCEAKREGKA